MKETNTRTELAPVKVGDWVHLNWQKSDFGLVVNVRRYSPTKSIALVNYNGTIRSLPAQWLVVVESEVI